MPVYGFRIDVEGDAIKSIKGIEGELIHLEQKSKQAQSQINDHFGKIGQSVKGFGMGLKSLAIGGLGIGALFGGVEFLKESMEAEDKYEENIAKLEAALESTHGAAGLELKELTDKAKELNEQTLFSKASIMDAQSMLLTFTQIKGAVFNEAIPAITDFATRYKMETADAALQVGKALNDPEKGLHRLTRMGVVFSAQQEEQIKHFMSINDVASAQRVMLNELNTEFGGLAKAMARTDEGKLKMAAKALTDMKITIGELITKGLSKLSPMVVKIGEGFEKVFGTKLSKQMEDARGEMNALFEVLKNGNLPLDERREIINRLNGEYKDYIPALITEKTTTAELAIEQQKANATMLKKIQIQAQKEVYEELFKMAAKAAKDRMEMEIKYQRAKTDKAGVATADVARYGILSAGGKSGEVTKEQVYKSKLDKAIEKEKEANDELQKNLRALPVDFLGGLNTKGLAETAKNVNDFLNGPKKVSKITPGSGLAENAINTSMLSGASGGLNEAKMIKIDFHAPLMKIDIPGGNGKDVVDKAPLAMEQLIRITNNLSQSQGAIF